jgi:uncharacterized protein YlaI
MSAQSLESQILHYLPELELDQKKSLLSVIKSFIRLKENQPVRRLTIEEYNKELDAAEARIEAGHFTTLEDVMKEAEKW